MAQDERPRRPVTPPVLIAAIASALLLASFFSRHFFEGPTRDLPARPPVAAGAPGTGMFRVAAIEGPVEALHGGQWYVVQAGDLLSLQDVIRTPKGSRAMLRRGTAEIEVREGVDVRLEKLATET